MGAMRRAGLALAATVLVVGLGGCAAIAAAEPSASAPVDVPSSTATPPVSDEWVTTALAMEAAAIDSWIAEWFDKGCGSVVVATGDPICTDHATAGAMLASNAPERGASLRAAGVDATALIAPADNVYAAAERYFASLCDREPTTDCIAPVDDLTSALPRYADAIRSYADAR
jgi:hypothetical protein